MLRLVLGKAAGSVVAVDSSGTANCSNACGQCHVSVLL